MFFGFFSLLNYVKKFNCTIINKSSVKEKKIMVNKKLFDSFRSLGKEF